MYNGVPIHTLQTMQDMPHVDRRTLGYLSAGASVLILLVFVVAASV